MVHNRETMQVRVGVVAVFFLISLIGGMKVIFLLLSLCVCCVLLGYALFRFVQENVVSIDSDGDLGEPQLLRIEVEKRKHT